MGILESSRCPSRMRNRRYRIPSFQPGSVIRTRQWQDILCAEGGDLMDRKSCIVIGAGLSGLAAAYELTKARWRVIVLEARDRTGGRVRTFRFPEAPHLYCELGGEWVGRGHKHMKALC